MNRKLLMLLLTAPTAMTAFAQKIVISNPVIDCGQVVFKHPVTAEYELKNGGRRDLTIKEVRTNCGCAIVEYPRNAVRAGDAFKVKVSYDARQMGHFQKLVGIYSNASASPTMLTLKAVVVRNLTNFKGSYPITLGTLRADVDEVEFEDVNRGAILQKKIHISNPTSETVQPVLMHLPNYLKAEVSPSKIAPGHSGTATLTLDSRFLRDFGLTQTTLYLGAFPGDKVAREKEIEVSAVLLPSFDKMTAAQLALAPQIALSADSLSLGAFGGKSKLKGVITITNKGRSTLRINNLQMSMTGLQLSLSSTRIEPGQEARLKVTALARQLQGSKRVPRVLMITNDPKQPKVVIRINVR